MLKSANLIFNKKYQKTLIDSYEIANRSYWNNDEKMVKYELSQVAYLVPICNNKFLISIDKVKLNKDFYFGYSDIGQGLSYEENNKRVSEFRKNLESNFKNSNLSGIESTIQLIERILNNETSEKAYHFTKYYKDKENTILHELGYEDPWRGKTFTGEGFLLSHYDLNHILEGYKRLYKDTEKKIDTYLKKYGTSKMHVSTYWIDE